MEITGDMQIRTPLDCVRTSIFKFHLSIDKHYRIYTSLSEMDVLGDRKLIKKTFKHGL